MELVKHKNADEVLKDSQVQERVAKLREEEASFLQSLKESRKPTVTSS